MMFIKLAITLPMLLALSSAMTLERKAPEDMNILTGIDTSTRNTRASLLQSPASACDKEDESDCKEFCKLSEQTATCIASGNKITCSCRGGKSESNCEERCLLCMPDKSALEEASLLFKLGGSRKSDL
ncbi:hypothetical protein EJ08DRAFT_59037 [Tothia fuscella]|uniref:Uncharacterized protein n=1 Tax=Tothia fuscella TaxID=1048955 RepID=A0A9P4NYS4_9PEZI|nr:hypothetical protein EJ08DRAFT_59037 [Tothia fuscella]